MPVPQHRGRRGLVATLVVFGLVGTAFGGEAGTREAGVAGPLPSDEVTRANALAAAGHRDEAIALLELRVSTEPQDALAKQTLLSLRISAMEEEIRRILGEQAKAKELIIGDPDYESARARADAAVSKRLDVAEYYAHNRRYPEAAMVCNAILKDYPHHPAALKLKYRILTEMIERERKELLRDKALRREDAINDAHDGAIIPGELPKSKRTIFVFDEDVADIERAALQKRLQQRVDLIYDGTNGTKSAQVREVLQPLFAIAGINYVILDSALGTETLTIHLVHETIETALATISKLVNIRYNYAGGTVYISSATSDVLVTEIIRVHSGLTDVITEPQLGANDFGGAGQQGGQGGQGPGGGQTNAGGGGGLFGGGATGGQQQGGGSQEFKSDLERFLEKVPDIVVGWPADGKIYLDKKSNTVYVRSTPHTIQEVKRLLQALDYNSTQVLIEARFIEVSDSAAKDLGINWAGGGKSGDAYVSSPTTGLSVPSPNDSGASIGTFDPGSVTGGFLAQVLVAPSDYLKFKAQIFALEQNGKADTLSEPKILTLNNAVGVIEVREDISYISGYQSAGYSNQPYYPNSNNNNNNVINPGYNYQTTTLVPQFTKDYQGISLKIRPSVARNSDIITLSVTPTVRELVRSGGTVEFTNPGGGDGDTPITNQIDRPPEFDTRRLVTALHVKNGGTVVLGGLTRERDEKQDSGVPFISRVPVIGSLFKRNTKVSSRSNLMIFVTAHIIDPQGAKQGDEIRQLRDTARVLLPAEVEAAERASAEAAAKPAAEAPKQQDTGPIWRRDRRR